MRWLAVLVLVAAGGTVAHAQEMPRVALEGNRLFVDGEPFFPYGCWGAIESIESMKRHHFTCVFSGMGGVPDLLEQAREHDFWVITYPYAPSWGPQHEEHVLAVRDHPNLLAWNIGDDIKAGDADQVRQAYDWISAHDPHGRPIMFDVIQGFEAFAWFDGMFNTYHYPLLKPETLLDYVAMLRREHEIVNPDAYLWTWEQGHVQIWYTQRYLDPEVQWMPSLYPDGEHLRLVAYSALAAGCRGILYFFNRYFTEEYHGVDRYAEAALVGCELEVVGPWLAMGDVGEELATSDPALHAWPVTFPGGTLVLLAVIKDDSQYHVDAARVEEGVVELRRELREGERVYHLTLDGGAREISGGVHGSSVSVPSVEMTGLLLVTDDAELAAGADAALQALTPDAGRYAAQGAGARRDKVARVLATLESEGYPGAAELRGAVESAGDEIARANNAIEGARYADAFRAARAASRVLRQATYDHWRRLNENEFVREAEVLPNFYLAETYYPMVRALAEAEPSPNLLTNPSFEESADGQVVGWADLPAAHEQVGSVSLTDQARSGQWALRLASESPTIYEGQERDWATASVSSEMVPVQQWDAIEAEVWVRIDEDLERTERGAFLQIVGYDESGESAGWSVTSVEAGRAQATDGWLRLCRRTVVTPSSVAQVGVRLGICGVGRVRFDDVALVRRRPVR